MESQVQETQNPAAQEQHETPAPPFELAPEHIELSLISNAAGRTFRLGHQLRRPLLPDWLAYDQSLAVAVESAEQEGLAFRDAGMEAACSLWDKLALEVSGYFSPEQEPGEWRSLVPTAHKKTAIDQLLSVTATQGELPEAAAYFFDLSAVEQTVIVSAIRGVRFPRLIHRFRAPSAAQQIQFHRIQGDSVIIRQQRNSGAGDKIMIPARLGRLVQLYDELIENVEGYVIQERPLASRDEIIQFMDAQHKGAAIRALFAAYAV